MVEEMKTRTEILCEINKQHDGTIHNLNEKYGLLFINMTNKDFFKFIYGLNLTLLRLKNPKKYSWPMGGMNQVLKRMLDAIDKFSFNKNSESFKATTKLLGIKNTYKAIKEYFECEAIWSNYSKTR